MAENVREMTFEEEYEILIKEEHELFATEKVDCEPPFANCVVRRALRCISKLLAEVIDYNAIGTVEECRIAMERMKPKKPVVKYGCTYRCPPDCGGEEFDEYGDIYHCPNCDRELSYSLDDVCRCGQAIDWRK